MQLKYACTRLVHMYISFMNGSQHNVTNIRDSEREHVELKIKSHHRIVERQKHISDSQHLKFQIYDNKHLAFSKLSTVPNTQCYTTPCALTFP